jgi:hypothetical protein
MDTMVPPRDRQQSLPFARPARRRGGLEVAQYRECMDRLQADAARVARHFGLPPFELDADRPDSRDRYGICFDDGRIRVRLVDVRTGRVLRYSALIDTVVHELAHLRHMDHGPRWEALYRRMLEWCREAGIYAPRPRRVPDTMPPSATGPVQLHLFRRRS